MNEFQKYLVSEFAEDYSEGRITRRQALRLILGVTGSLAVANSILAACTPPPEQANPTPSDVSPTTGESATSQPTQTNQPEPSPTAFSPSETPQIPNTGTQTPAASAASGTVTPDDPAVIAEEITFTSPDDGAEILAYLARPAGDGQPVPVIMVCHENRGLTAHIQDVTRRLAKAGYVALAVDLLSRSGGTGSLSADAVPGALGNTEPDQFVADFLAGWGYLQGQTYAQADRVGMVGFCFGGMVTWRVATHMPELLAAVPFYGSATPASDVPTIQAAVLGIYGELDQRINQGIPAIEEAMAANNKVYEKMIYPGADHAFHNDTSPRYNPEAAQDAWARTLEWFGRYVNS